MKTMYVSDVDSSTISEFERKGFRIIKIDTLENKEKIYQILYRKKRGF